MDDDFNDNSLNLGLWDPFVFPTSGSGAVSETNGQLEITLNAGQVNAGIRSRCSVASDFDVQVDFTLLNWPPDNRQGFSLGAVDLGQGPFGVNRVERFSENGEFYHMVFLNASGTAVPANEISGKLRLVRTNDILKGFYHDGTGFVEIPGLPNDVRGPTRLVLTGGLNRPDAIAASFAFDNFRVNAGIVQCPSP